MLKDDIQLTVNDDFIIQDESEDNDLYIRKTMLYNNNLLIITTNIIIYVIHNEYSF